MSDLITDAQLAARFGIDVTRLHILRRRNGWPFVRFGRKDIRFTAEQVDQIVALQSVTTPAPAEPAKPAKGQTARSASRNH